MICIFGGKSGHCSKRKRDREINKALRVLTIVNNSTICEKQDNTGGGPVYKCTG